MMNLKTKSIILLLAVLVLLAGYAGVSAQAERLQIVTTIFPIYDFARVIAGDTADVSLMLPAGADSHSFEPTPRDIVTVQNAGLFIYIGGESDTWVERILKSFGDQVPATLALIHSVSPLDEEYVEGMQQEDDHLHDDNGEADEHDEHDEEASGADMPHEGEVDEHIWTSPLNAILMVEQIRDTLSKLDPANSSLFASNAESYIAELRNLDRGYREMVNSSKRKLFMVADRFPFRYLAHEYGLQYYAAFPGCSTDTDPGASTVAFLIDKARENQLPVVFTLENSNQIVAHTIADASGARVEVLNAAHNVGGQADLSNTSYLAIMRENIEKLRDALN